jgi:SAM-dependent methyltransferase
MTNSRSCRLCGFTGPDAVIELNGMPRWNHRLLGAHELAADRGVDLKVFRCRSCGFVSMAMGLCGEYYADYLNVPSLSAQARQFQNDQARSFVKRFGLIGARILEVGCGDGFFSRAMQDAGGNCVGIEPSAAQRRLAHARGLKVEPGILSAGRRLANAPFDAFVTRQVLEHVEDIRDFLLTIRCNLRSGAVGLVEVPNLDKLVAEARFFDFIPEHINYFTPRSLSMALQLAGFETLEVCSVQEGESLRAYVRWQTLPDYEPIARRVESLRSDIGEFVATCRAQGKKVAIWGAGGKGLSMMAAADVSQVELVVDSDASKVGLYTPVSHLRVSAVRELASQGIDAVIVMAPAYEDEIARTLRSDLKFAGQIVLAGRGFRVVD